MAAQSFADTSSSREYQVKAAFLYNFLMFVDWPQEKMDDSNSPIIIGIIGIDPFDGAFEPVKDKKANGKQVIVKHFEPFKEMKKNGNTAEYGKKIEDVRKCHLLFICRSEAERLKEILDLVRGYSVLTVADMPDFIEPYEGMINFIMEDKKVRFEINLAAAQQANLKIRSQLLRLAKRVIGEESTQEAEK